MGCDIHSFAEKRNDKNSKWVKVKDHFLLDDFDRDWYKKEKGDSPFENRNYSWFAFLADVRNYDHCEPIKQPCGIPSDCDVEIMKDYEDYGEDAHSASHLTLKELLDFDYEVIFWNRRITKQLSSNSFTGAGLAQDGEGKMLTYRENLGTDFFKIIEELKLLGEPENVRVVFWFDN